MKKKYKTKKYIHPLWQMSKMRKRVDSHVVWQTGNLK